MAVQGLLVAVVVLLSSVEGFSLRGGGYASIQSSPQRLRQWRSAPIAPQSLPPVLGQARRSMSMSSTSEIQTYPATQNNRRRDTSPLLPQHPDLVQGRLDNGFTYLILPNTNPAGRFEAHLEVLSGSAHELERQQGVAHLLEHVAYMGSPKRQLISGTGSRTNAYTDFHHTVFFAACPTSSPDQFWKKPMLPLALDALLDVMTTQVDNDRLEKERAAVLSEASMVNKMEYRVECQVLSALHSENRISTRFPIGKENLIKKWTKEDVQMFHSTHYRPDNVILFVVGDVDVKTTIDTIKQKFGGLKPKIDSQLLFKESGEFPATSMESVSRHFPPVVHRWSCPPDEAAFFVPPALVAPAPLPLEQQAAGGSLPVPRIFMHELLQSFSFHLFAKRPIEPIVSFEALRRDLMRRMSLSALQIRFNVQQRQDPLLTFVDFNQLNWPREGCAVCSLDLTADASSWRDAVKLAVREIRRLGVFGLSQNEVGRYKQAVLSEAEQQVAQADQLGSEEVVTQLMEAEACGHTFMEPSKKLAATRAALDSITVEDVNEVARSLCEHLSHMDAEGGVRPAAVIACAPALSRSGAPFSVSDADVTDAMLEALAEPIEPLHDLIVPETLLDDEVMETKAKLTKPAWVPVQGKGAAAGNGKNSMGVVQRRLSNGLRVNLLSLDVEPQRACVRVYVPGGRLLEQKGSEGAVLVGSRTMQEGGAFLDLSREEVELFCIDQMVMVDIVTQDDALIFDFQAVTTPGPGGKVTGLEACMQVAHIILTDFKYEEDAFERARQGLHEQFDSVVKGLETACQERVLSSLTGADFRLLTPDHEQIEALSLAKVKAAIVSQLGPDSVEVSISGDASMAVLEGLSLKYLGTVPAREASAQRPLPQQTLKVTTLGKAQQLNVFLQDSDERAMGYCAGPCPNKWGLLPDGSSVSEAIKGLAGAKGKDPRRDHPLFGHAVLLVLQDVSASCPPLLFFLSPSLRVSHCRLSPPPSPSIRLSTGASSQSCARSGASRTMPPSNFSALTAPSAATTW